MPAGFYAEPSFGPTPVGETCEGSRTASPQTVNLTVTVAPHSTTAAENVKLRAEIRRLELRVTREAQMWAEQRAALVKEREELRRQVDERDAQNWKLMNGEVTMTGAAGKVMAKRKAAKDAGEKPSPAKRGVGGAKAGAKVGIGKPAAKLGATKSAAKGSMAFSTSKSGGGLAALPKPPKPDGVSEVETAAVTAAAAKQAEVAAAALLAKAAAEKAVAQAKAAVSLQAVAMPPPPQLTEDGAPSAMIGMVSAASALMGSLFGGGKDGSADDLHGCAGAEPPPPPRTLKLGLRSRPDWVPAIDIHKAMVRTPRVRQRAAALNMDGVGKKSIQLSQQQQLATKQVQKTA